MRPYAPPPQSCTSFSTRRQFSLTQSGQYGSNIPAPPLSTPRMRYQVPNFVGNDRLQVGTRPELRLRSGVNQPIHTPSKRSKTEDFSSWLQKDQEYCLSSESLPVKEQQPEPPIMHSRRMKSTRLLFESTEYSDNDSAADRYAYSEQDQHSSMHGTMDPFATPLRRATSSLMRMSGTIPPAPQSARGYRQRSFSISSADGSSPNAIPTPPQSQAGLRGSIPHVWQPSFLPRESSAERIARVRREASLESRKRFALEREAAKAAAIAKEEARQKYLEIQLSMRTTQRDRILLARDKVEKDGLILIYALIVLQYYQDQEEEILDKIRSCGLQDFRRLPNVDTSNSQIFEKIDFLFIKEMENFKISQENLEILLKKFQEEKILMDRKSNFIQEFQIFLKEKNFDVNDGICDELKQFILINEYGMEVPRL